MAMDAGQQNIPHYEGPMIARGRAWITRKVARARKYFILLVIRKHAIENRVSPRLVLFVHSQRRSI